MAWCTTPPLRIGPTAVALLLCALGAAWPGPGGAAPRPDATPEAVPGTASGASPGTGSVRGRVAFPPDVPVPEPRRVANTTDPQACGEVMALGDLVVSGERGLAHVVVALTGVPDEAIPPLAPDEPHGAVLDNAECRFRPRVVSLRSGAALRLRNSDPILHTVHLYGPEELNVALPMAEMEVERRLTETGIYPVRCDVHGWMQAFVRVDPHPFHAVTGVDGAFEIRAVPAGTYTVEAWHERLGFLRREVTVEAGAATSLDLTYPASRARPDGKEPS